MLYHFLLIHFSCSSPFNTPSPIVCLGSLLYGGVGIAVLLSDIFPSTVGDSPVKYRMYSDIFNECLHIFTVFTSEECLHSSHFIECVLTISKSTLGTWSLNLFESQFCLLAQYWLFSRLLISSQFFRICHRLKTRFWRAPCPGLSRLPGTDYQSCRICVTLFSSQHHFSVLCEISRHNVQLQFKKQIRTIN